MCQNTDGNIQTHKITDEESNWTRFVLLLEREAT